jgi:hypothetical protein
MGKFLPDATIDQSLDYVALSDYLCACSGSPITFTAAYTTNMLSKVAVSAGDFAKADDVSGRKLTISAKSGVSITNSGFAEAIALVNTSGSTLRLVTTCTGQQLTAGGTVDFPSFKYNIADPT